MNTLIAFYSRAGENYVDGALQTLAVGNTEVVARTIRRYVGGDLYPILPAQPYSESYCECINQAKQDLSRGVRPPLAGPSIDLSGYDVICLGWPNYWNTLPMPVVTFLEAHDLSDKVILPFCTHEGGGFGRALRDLSRLCPGAEIWDGLAIRGARVALEEEAIAEWAAERLRPVKKEPSPGDKT